jgi:uncharacterized protein (TIGR00730 family)
MSETDSRFGPTGDENGRGGRHQREARNSRPKLPADKPVIAVFGASRARPGDGLYEQGYRIGELLGRAGFNVMTGGYTGLMEAASRGAHSSGAYVIGITLKRFEEKANRFITDEISTASFGARFRWLIGRADGYIAMPGGMGTLAEVSFAWQELAIGMISPRPLVLVGPRWRTIVESWRENLTTESDKYARITLVESPEDACQAVTAYFARKRTAQRAY